MSLPVRLRITLIGIALLSSTVAHADVIDCKAGAEFYKKLGMAFFIIKQCPTLKLNKIKSEEMATALGIDLKANIPKECASEWNKAIVSSMALATMLNDKGGPYPCDKVPIGDSKTDVFDFIEK